MIERAIRTDPSAAGRRSMAPDERSMRIVELVLAGISLAAAILLSIAR